jgi:hypothetical protein
VAGAGKFLQASRDARAVEVQQLAEQFFLGDQRHQRIVRFVLKQCLDEGYGTLGLVVAKAIEIDRRRVRAVGSILEADAAHFTPGPHQFFRGKSLEPRLHLFAGWSGHPVEAKLRVAPMHRAWYLLA